MYMDLGCAHLPNGNMQFLFSEEFRDLDFCVFVVIWIFSLTAVGVAVPEIKSTLVPSYKIILNDLKSLIEVMKHNITAEGR